MSLQVVPVRSFQRIGELAESGDIYVINNSDLSNKQSRGTVVMDIIGDNGQSFGVTIPDTWLPINLSSYCDPKLYMKSNTFRNLVSKNVLIVIDTKHAENILATHEAKNEKSRVDEINSAYARNLQQGIAIVENGDPITINTSASITEVVRPEAPTNVDDNHLHNLVATFNSGGIDDRKAIEQLITLKPSVEALKEVSGDIGNTGSQFYTKIADLIAESTSTAPGNYTGPERPAGL